MSNQVVNRNVNIYINDQEAEKSLKNLKEKSDKLTKAIKDGEAAGKDMTKSIEKLAAVNGKMEMLQQVVDGKIRPSFRMMKDEVARLNMELSRMSADAPGYAEKFAEFKKASAVFDEMKTKVGGVKGAVRSFGDEVKGIVSGVVIGNVFTSLMTGVASYFSGMISGNAKLSDSMADVDKATGLTAGQVKTLNSELGKIDTRTSTSDLREIAIGLGQVGEEANKLNVEAIDKIVVALGDEFGGGAKEITTELSVIRNNLDDIKTGDYGTDIMHIGNAMNELGANGLATAPVITDITNRVSGVARTFGISSGQILGLAATFQELGINTERGSTAYVKTIQKIAAEPKKFAGVIKAAGMDVKEFYNLVNTDLNAAFLQVAKASKTAGNSNTAFGKILKDLDSDGAGVSELLSKLAVNQEMVAQKTKLATNALQSNSSILSEFDKKNNTLGANLEKLGKNMSSLFANSVLSEGLNSIVKALSSATSKSKSLTEEFDAQLKSVVNLETNTRPLIARYDELQAKAKKLGGETKLTKDEQAELKTIVSQVTAVMPGAASAQDMYGNAIAINTGRVREFIDAEKDRLKVLNNKSIEEQTKNLKTLADQINITGSKLKEVNQTGTFKVLTPGTTGYNFRKATQEEVRQLEERNTQLLSQYKGTFSEIERLNGNALQKQLDASKTAKQPATGPVVPPAATGTGATSSSSAIDKTESKAERLRKKLEEVRGEMAKLAQEMGVSNADQYSQDLTKINLKYDELEKKLRAAGASQQDFVKAQDLRNGEIENLNEKYHQKLVEFVAEQDSKMSKLSMDAHQKELEDLNNFYDDKEKLMRRDGRTLITLYEQRLKDMKAIDLKYADKASEDRFKELTESLGKTPRQSSNKVREELTRPNKQSGFDPKQTDKLKQYLKYAETAVNITGTLANIQRNTDDAELARSRKLYNDKQANYKRMLDQHMISQSEYDAKTANLQKEQEQRELKIKKRQFEREKKMQIANALISGAQAIVSTYAALPGLADIFTFGTARGIENIIVAASTAAQIGVIASQKFPEYAGGGTLPNSGVLDGPSHAQGGIKMIDTKTGQVKAEVEGGEMLYSKKFYRNNKGFMDSMLSYSHATGGAPLNINWMNAPAPTINASAIAGQISTVRKFAAGGVLPSGGGSSAGNNAFDQRFYQQFFQDMKGLLGRPIKAYTVLSEHEAQQSRIDDIRAAGTIK